MRTTYSITTGHKHRSRGVGFGLVGGESHHNPSMMTLAGVTNQQLSLPRSTSIGDDARSNDDDDQVKSRRRKLHLQQRKRGRGRSGTNGNGILTVRGGMLALGTVCLVLAVTAYRRLRDQKSRHVVQRRERAERLFHEREGHGKKKLQNMDPTKPYTNPKVHERNAQQPLNQADGQPPAPVDVHQQLAHLPTVPYERTRLLNEAFQEHRGGSQANVVLQALLQYLNHDVQHNVDGGMRWIRPYLLPPLPGKRSDRRNNNNNKDSSLLRGGRKNFDRPQEYFRIRRSKQRMKWQDEWDAMSAQEQNRGPAVDYTNATKYTYPPIPSIPPPAQSYPVLRPLGQIMSDWKQDEDYDNVIHESLMHFNYSNPLEVEMAKRYREAKVPFKFYDVPEVMAATQIWTDEYVDAHYRGQRQAPRPQGTAQESPNNYFAFFYPEKWNVDVVGLPPTRNTDWSFAQWAAHARYADAVRLSPQQPHFYWQSGIPATERHNPHDQWTFVSRDLPSFSSPTETFFVWHPEQQKGIQCRFGERFVAVATHYDSGRNSVAMITGAKRYILSPPRACSKLGVFTSSDSAIYRHSLLNFAHIPYATDLSNDMSPEEREWLHRAGTAEAVETVVKAGEVLYIPSHWFHYIVSLQKSAQCNVRSGVDVDGTDSFGGKDTVRVCKDWTAAGGGSVAS